LVPLIASGEYLGLLSVGHAEPSPAFTAGIASRGYDIDPDMPVFESATVMVMARFFDAGMGSMNMGFPVFTA